MIGMLYRIEGRLRVLHQMATDAVEARHRKEKENATYRHCD